MPVFALTIFVGAFLLFQVQPLIAKFILPWFGGSPSVWTSALLFFQVLLLAGYAYAHFSIRQLGARAQVVVHLVLLLAALAFLPIVPAAEWKPEAAEAPTLRIVFLLAATVGLPYFLLASTSPLFQAWFSRLNPGVLPYRLYALSNVGSLLALISYPVIVEPAIGRLVQARTWSVAFVVFAALNAVSATLMWKHVDGGTGDVPDGLWDDPERPSALTRLLWLGLPATASVLLLAVTNQITQDVAVVPLLWILPLSLYLLSFIVAFDHERWYYRPAFAGGLIPAMALSLWIMSTGQERSAAVQIGIFCLVLFMCCMACHGEVARLKPHPRHLTAYYLLIAAGGALGGLFVAVVAPVVFDLFLELHIGLLGTCLFVFLAFITDRHAAFKEKTRRWLWGTLGIAVATVAAGLAWQVRSTAGEAIARSRNFYGTLRVFEEYVGTPNARRVLRHGAITHGVQYKAPHRRREATVYFGEWTGIGRLMRTQRVDREWHVGVVGLGVGTLATYGKQGDRFRFYEIDPDVQRFAETYFSYLADAEASVQVVLGDARLSLEREDPQNFDVLVLDAFSGDAIPVHLLTAEAFDVYLRHVHSRGVIAIQVTNRYVNMRPVIFDHAKRLGLHATLIETESGGFGVWKTDWILVARNRSVLDVVDIQRAASQPPLVPDELRQWTDDYSNLFQVLRF